MSYACVRVVYLSVSKIALTYITFSIILSWLSPCAQYAAAVMWFVKYPRLLHIRQKELWSSKREAVKRPFSCFHQSNPSRSPEHELGTPATITAQVFHFIFLSKIHFWCWNSVKALATPSVSVNISVDTCNGPHSYTTHTKSQWSYLASLVFGENCRKIGVNTSGWESIKWWHHQCVSHEVMTSPMSVQSESSICGGGFPNIMNIYYKSSCDIINFCFYFISPRLFLTAPSNSKAHQGGSMMVLGNSQAKTGIYWVDQYDNLNNILISVFPVQQTNQH